MGEDKAVQAGTLKAAKVGELERIYLLLGDQKELLSTLQNRLQTVSHPVPSEPSNEVRGEQINPHLSHVGDLIGEHNTWLRQILAELAL